MTSAASPREQASEWLGASRAGILCGLAAVAEGPLRQAGRPGGAPDLFPAVAGHLLDGLRRALAWDAAIFADCVAWARAELSERGVPAAAAALLLEQLRSVIREHLAGAGSQASAVVQAALEAVSATPEPMPVLLQPGPLASPLPTFYFRALLRGDRHLASRLVLDAVERGTPVKDIYLSVFQPSLHEIGRLWQLNKISVAEEHYSTAATQLIMSQIYSHVFASERIGRTVVAACVNGDLHELGARMVADFFEMDGWDSYYTGASTPVDGVLQAVVERRADVLAVSATITHHVPDVKRLIGLVRGHPQCGGIKVIVGGFPFNRDPALWQQVGADGSGIDAKTAVAVGNRLVCAGRAAGA